MPLLHTWGLTMHTAVIAAITLLSVSVTARFVPRRWTSVVATASWEAALICAVYALWQLVGDMARTRVVGGMSHGLAVWHFERALDLPNEATFQQIFLPHHLLIQAANLYYASAHLNSMWIFLVWLWVWHRDHYARARNVVVFSTAFCLLVQMIPVAPPRFLDGIGVIDTPLLYHESVYGAFGETIPQQLSAMPSVHVAWAVLIGYVVLKVSSSRWRWLILVHVALTILVVTITGNHYWLDGVAAAALVVLAAYVERVRARAFVPIARWGQRLIVKAPLTSPT